MDEFPRPTPTKKILKLKSNVTQMDSYFPFLAISTSSAMYLCDLEKEDFTRVKNKNRDIKTRGFCFVPVKNNVSGAKKEKLKLLIVEEGSNCILHCSTEGFILDQNDIEQTENENNNQCTMSCLFDPRQESPEFVKSSSTVSEKPYLRKLFCSEDGSTLISISTTDISLLDSETYKVRMRMNQLGDLKRLKFVSNYGFLWHGDEIEVWAFTNFWSYGQQLFDGELHSILNRWVAHLLNCIGWKQDCNDSETKSGNESAAQLFRSLMQNCDEENPFFAYLCSITPFDLIPSNHNEETDSTDQKLQRSVISFITDLTAVNNTEVKEWETMQITLQCLYRFYIQLGCDFTPCTGNELTLHAALSSLHTFLMQLQVSNMCQGIDAVENGLKLKQMLENILSQYLGFCANEALKGIDVSQNNVLHELILSDFSSMSNFVKYNQEATDWFNLIGISSQQVYCDVLLADLATLLVPILGTSTVLKCLEPFESLNGENLSIVMFFTWLVTNSVLQHETAYSPYGTLVRTLRNDQLFPQVAQDVIRSVYRDILKADISGPSNCLHHFISAFHLLSLDKSMEDRKRKDLGLSLLISCCPLSIPEEIVRKVSSLCKKNHILLNLFKLSVRRKNGQSFQLCPCGVQKLITNTSYSEVKVASNPMQSAIEHGVLKALMEKYDQKSENGHTNLAYKFASETGLMNFFFSNSELVNTILSDQVQIEIILRSGSCSLLNKFQFTTTRCNNLVEQLVYFNEELKNVHAGATLICSICKCCDLQLEDGFKSLSWDCVGLWILNAFHKWDQRLQLISNSSVLNARGIFSLRFVKELRKYNILLHGNQSLHLVYL